jgi:hypothetical protein
MTLDQVQQLAHVRLARQVLYHWVIPLVLQILIKHFNLAVLQYVTVFPHLYIIYVYVFVCGRQALYLLSPSSSHFCYRYFSNRVSHLCPGQLRLQSSYLCFLHSWMIGLCHHTQFFIGWDRVFWIFCLGWPQTTVFLSSDSKVARHELCLPPYIFIVLSFYLT